MFADIAWQLASEGVTLQNGVAAAIGGQTRRWLFGVEGEASFGAEKGGNVASYEVSRHEVLGFADLALVNRPDLVVGTGIDAGVAFFARRTLSTAAGATATPSALDPSFIGGLRLSLRWLPSRWGHRVGPWMLLGGDVVPGAPTFGYNAGGSFLPTANAWKLEPRAQLGVEVRAF
jgi:hypothetical protein